MKHTVCTRKLNNGTPVLVVDLRKLGEALVCAAIIITIMLAPSLLQEKGVLLCQSSQSETLKMHTKTNRQHRNGTRANAHWLCKCDCGNPQIKSVTGYQLKTGHTQSCGCYASEQIAKRNKEYSTKTN